MCFMLLKLYVYLGYICNVEECKIFKEEGGIFIVQRFKSFILFSEVVGGSSCIIIYLIKMSFYIFIYWDKQFECKVINVIMNCCEI